MAAGALPHTLRHRPRWGTYSAAQTLAGFAGMGEGREYKRWKDRGEGRESRGKGGQEREE